GRVLTFRVSASWAETADYKRLIQRIDGMIEEVRALPGVDAAATALFLPGVPAQYESAFKLVEGRGDPEARMVAENRVVSAEYFATMQIPLVSGQPCTRRPLDGVSDIMVNRAFATRYLSGWSSAVGLHLSTQSMLPLGRIVGIVGDARERGLDSDLGPIVYTCFSAPTPTPYFLVRTHGEPAAIVQSVRLKVKELEPLRAVYDIAPLEERIDDSFSQNRLRMVLLVLFAITALSLACVGLYGTLSYVVSLRRREVGLRLALGARRTTIVRQFLLKGLRVAGCASACGLVLAGGFTHVLAGMLYGVSASDPVTLVGVTAIVLAVAAMASLLPALRASRFDPMHLLREE
ncbi:MAG: FtsX-like permease family protein, partial [Acidobacteria bacterium]